MSTQLRNPTKTSPEPGSGRINVSSGSDRTYINEASSTSINCGCKHNMNSVNDGENVEFLTRINHLIFSQSNEEYFPIVIQLSRWNKDINKVIRQYDVNNDDNKLVVRVSEKSVADDIIPKLLRVDNELVLNYTNFISHPGNLFVKNFTRSKVNHDSIFQFINNQSLYKSLKEVNIFNCDEENSGSSDNDIFVIARFNNYLDIDHLLSNPCKTNPFHNGNVPLYFNRYISKKQRKLSNDDSNDDFNNFNTITVENFSKFFPKDYEFSISNLNKVFEKFELFGPIQSIYFPINIDESGSLSVLNFGYVTFDIGDHGNLGLLTCIYFLNNLSYEEFMNFSQNDIYNLLQDLSQEANDDNESNSNESNSNESNESNSNESNSNESTIKLSISQHKHNHYLFQYVSHYLDYITNETSLTIRFCYPGYYPTLVAGLIKQVNYQETNIYVNNFPFLFNNDDKLWELFWNKFGGIKLAKIIKPQYYSKGNQNIGKIGFVFFNSFKSTLRAIILTNNKLINVNNSNHLIKSSFAIQKVNKDRFRSFSFSLSAASSPSVPQFPPMEYPLYYPSYYQDDEDSDESEYRPGPGPGPGPGPVPGPTAIPPGMTIPPGMAIPPGMISPPMAQMPPFTSGYMYPVPYYMPYYKSFDHS